MNLELPFPGRLSIKAPEKLILDEERLKDPLKDRQVSIADAPLPP